MKQHRGVGSFLFILLVAGGLLLLAWAASGNNFQGITMLQNTEQRSTSTQDSDWESNLENETFIYNDPESTRKSLITEQRDEKMAEYSLGIYYTLINFTAFSRYLRENGESYERLCANGKVNRDDPEVQRTVEEILCGPNNKCEGVPYIFRS
jgi:hypothetical protein